MAMARSLLVLLLLGFACLGVAARADEDEGDQFMSPFDPGLTERIRKANDECFGCHSREGLQAPPRTGMDMAKLATLVVSREHYADSVHTGMDCRDCHGNALEAYPHPSPAKASKPCIDCHARRVAEVEPQFKASVHYKKFPAKFDCQTCHDAHVYGTAKRIDKPRELVRQDNASCIDCHDSPLLYGAVVGPGKTMPDFRRTHDWLPNRNLHWDGVRCVDCHTPVPGELVSHEVLAKERTSMECVNCHTLRSALNKRLYRHLVDESAAPGTFTNTLILTENYVVGATRSVWLDRLAVVLILAMLGVTVLHGLIRWALALLRSRRH